MAVPIEQIRLGQRVIGENPEPFDVDPDLSDPVQSETRRIAATVLKEDGTTIDNGTMHDDTNGITQSLNGQDSRLQSFETFTPKLAAWLVHTAQATSAAADTYSLTPQGFLAMRFAESAHQNPGRR